MPGSNPFLLQAIASMSGVAPISYRRVFSGYGIKQKHVHFAHIVHQHVQFALIVRDRLYFRADEESRSLYIARQMNAFLPEAVLESNFFQVPEEVLAHPDELRYWMRIAVEAAQHSYSLEHDEPTRAELPMHKARMHRVR
jgi:DNA transformation protein and related proteins